MAVQPVETSYQTATLTDRVERTNALLVEIAALWPDGKPVLSIHKLPHEVIHESSALTDYFLGGNGHPTFLSTKPDELGLFGVPDLGCATCVALPTTKPSDLR